MKKMYNPDIWCVWEILRKQKNFEEKSMVNFHK